MAQAAKSDKLTQEQIEDLTVRCLLLPLHEMMLLVPNTLVAEVMEFRPAEPTQNMPEWLSGMLSWRGRNVPVISFERLLGREVAVRSEERRYVICNTLNGNPRLPFLALEVVGIPHLSLVKNDALISDEGDTEREPAVLANLRLNEESVIVPNIDVMEKMLEHLGIATS
ncbi:MAG: chemotaxis protein CheW [Pseudomonadota bacterium]